MCGWPTFAPFCDLFLHSGGCVLCWVVAFEFHAIPFVHPLGCAIESFSPSPCLCLYSEEILLIFFSGSFQPYTEVSSPLWNHSILTKRHRRETDTLFCLPYHRFFDLTHFVIIKLPFDYDSMKRNFPRPLSA